MITNPSTSVRPESPHNFMHHLVCPQTMGGAHQGAGHPHPARCGAASPQVHKCRHTRCTEGWRVGKSSPITHNGAKATKPHDQAKGWRVGKKEPQTTWVPQHQHPSTAGPTCTENPMPRTSCPQPQGGLSKYLDKGAIPMPPTSKNRAHLISILHDLQHMQAKDRAMTEDAEIVPGHN